MGQHAVPIVLLVVAAAILAGAAPAADDGVYVIKGPERSLADVTATYSGMPPVSYTPPRNRFALMPRAARRMGRDGALTVLMLGDSIVNDTSRSSWEILVPGVAIRKTTVVRGSTGCWWYQEEGRVRRYVLNYYPDLVIIGGISHREDIEAIRGVIRQVRANSSADILLMSPAFGQVDPAADRSWERPTAPGGKEFRSRLAGLATEERCAFLDMSAAWGRAIVEGGRGIEWYKRDEVHANPRGEQVVGRILAAYLTPAARPVRAAHRPEVWLGHVHPEPLAQPGARWPVVQKELDTLQFAINALAFLIKREDLQPLVTLLKRNRTRISMECGYFDWEPQQADFSAPNPKGITDRVRMEVKPGVGVETARTEMAKIAHLAACGAAPDYIVMDGPIRRLMHPGADTGLVTPDGPARGLATIDGACTEVIGYMREWRKHYPKVRFMALTNFPNWGWRGGMSYQASGPNGMFWGDYYPVITRLVERAREAGLPLAGVTCDNPYEYALGSIRFGAPWPAPTQDPDAVDWLARVADLKWTVESRGVPFNMIINSQGAGGVSDEAFARETLGYLDLFRAAAGAPARYTFQTWYSFPKRLEPEDDQATFTGAVREAIRRLDNRAHSAPTAPDTKGKQ